MTTDSTKKNSKKTKTSLFDLFIYSKKRFRMRRTQSFLNSIAYHVFYFDIGKTKLIIKLKKENN